MEIDPGYADCICRRFEEYTGTPAVLADDGRAFEKVAEQRKGKRREAVLVPGSRPAVGDIEDRLEGKEQR
jgi:hypothetical protein